MTRYTFYRVMLVRKRNELWNEACFLEDTASKSHRRRAFRLLQEAVKLGEKDAQSSLAIAYDLGTGTRRSLRMSLHWDRKAWRSGSSTSARNRALTLLREGKTTSAIEWFYKAIASGNPDARLDLAKLFLSTPASRAHAMRLLKEHVQAGPQKTYMVYPGTTQPPQETQDEGFEEAKRLLGELELSTF